MLHARSNRFPPRYSRKSRVTSGSGALSGSGLVRVTRPPAASLGGIASGTVRGKELWFSAEVLSVDVGREGQRNRESKVQEVATQQMPSR